jgi:hypothetical protein
VNLLPDKHVSLGSSLLGVGATILRKLDQPSTITGLWDRCRPSQEVATFGRFSLALDLLFAIGAISIENDVLVRSR